MTDEIGNEVKLKYWKETAGGGQEVAFWLNEPGENPFKGLAWGKYGQRFQMMLVKINDDESTG